jgi:hypothetical protein
MSLKEFAYEGLAVASGEYGKAEQEAEVMLAERKERKFEKMKKVS